MKWHTFTSNEYGQSHDSYEDAVNHVQKEQKTTERPYRLLGVYRIGKMYIATAKAALLFGFTFPELSGE